MTESERLHKVKIAAGREFLGNFILYTQEGGPSSPRAARRAYEASLDTCLMLYRVACGKNGQVPLGGYDYRPAAEEFLALPELAELRKAPALAAILDSVGDECDPVDAIRDELRAWAESETSRPARRDDLVRRAIDAAVPIKEIARLSGISHTTIRQIRDPQGPVAVREAARRALRNRGITVPEIATMKGGEVRLWLPLSDEPESLGADDPYFDDAEYEHQRASRKRAEWIGRMNWAGAILDALRGAEIVVTASDEPHGQDMREHLAHESEQHVVLSLRERTVS